MKPTICGENRMYVPQGGCSDCAELEYEIQQLRNEFESFRDSFEFMRAGDIEDATPIECLQPVGISGRACVGEADLAQVCNSTSD